MTSITIDLDDAVYARLLEQAKARDIDVADLVAEAATARSVISDVSPEDLAIMDEIIEAYRPVFHRLAQ